MIRKCIATDFNTIYEIINDAAQAYQGFIPADCWHEPYMSKEELTHEIQHGVDFWGFEYDTKLVGVMGIQPLQDVVLIRHAYVRTELRNKGIGGKLLIRLCQLTSSPILIGTWAAADWAIAFYRKHGFWLVASQVEKVQLLKKYWSIPERQIETSVVLGDRVWFNQKQQE